MHKPETPNPPTIWRTVETLNTFQARLNTTEICRFPLNPETLNPKPCDSCCTATPYKHSSQAKQVVLEAF